MKFKIPWEPKPVEPPKIAPDLDHMDGLTRSAESIRYSILSIEFWISRNGQVREWLRLNTRCATWLIIPAMLVVPIITFLLWHLSKWVTILTSMAGHLIVLPILALIAGMVILVVINIARSIFH